MNQVDKALNKVSITFLIFLTKMWLSIEFFAEILLAVMHERWINCGNIAAMRRAASGDGVLPCLSLQYVLQC
jgi:hypothetical protein